jgi:hypothetical protein
MTDEENNGRIEDPDEDRAIAAFLDAVAPALRDEAVWAEPPAGLADSIIAAIAAERRAPPPDLETSPTAVPTAPPSVAAARRRRRSRAGWWVGAAAAAAVAALAIGIVATRDDEGPVEAFPIEGTDLAPDADASAVVKELGAGVAISLDVHDLPAAPEGFYYQGWVRNDEDEAVTVGTFHMRSGDATVTLWSGVDVHEYSTLTITLQKEGGGPESSGKVYLRGSIEP